MSRTYLVRKNKHQKQPKIQLQEYLYSTDEPIEDTRRELKIRLGIKETDENDIMRLYLIRMSRRFKSRLV